MSIWSKLNHFHQGEKWGNKDKVNGLLLLLLDIITDRIKQYSWEKYKRISPCIIHCAYETTGHSANSQHYKGNAADFHFENVNLPEAYNIILAVLKEYQVEEFTGLGVYPDWHTPGFHLDLRGEKARWSRINGVYRRIEDTFIHLNKS